MTVEEFKDIISANTSSILVQKYLFDYPAHCFVDNPELYSEFRSKICNAFEIHEQNFTIVGSAKTGFSLAPGKYGKVFSDTSDIDIVIVSDKLFTFLWSELLAFRKRTLYKLNPTYKKRFNELQWIMFFGNIRLDKLSNDFDFAKKWWEFFNSISKDSRFGPRLVRGTIYRSWNHVSDYYEKSFDDLRTKIEQEAAHESNGD